MLPDDQLVFLEYVQYKIMLNMPHRSSGGPLFGSLHVVLQAVDIFTSLFVMLPSVTGPGWTHKKCFLYKQIVDCP